MRVQAIVPCRYLVNSVVAYDDMLLTIVDVNNDSVRLSPSFRNSEDRIIVEVPFSGIVWNSIVPVNYFVQGKRFVQHGTVRRRG